SELLQEDRGALRWAKKQDGIHIWQIQSLIEEVGSEEHIDPAIPKVAQGLVALVGRGVSTHRASWDTSACKRLRHESGMFHTNTEAQRPHRMGVWDLVARLLQDDCGPCVITRVEVGELPLVVAAA